jgi:hypothetical protein
MLGKCWGKLRSAFNNALIKSRATFNLERVHQQDSTAVPATLAIAIQALSAADFGTKECVAGAPPESVAATIGQVSSE